MMARCRAICHAKGLKPQLHEQSMLDFCLPRKFNLVILPSGSLSLFTSDDDIRAMCARVMQHLNPGGMFIRAGAGVLRVTKSNGMFIAGTP